MSMPINKRSWVTFLCWFLSLSWLIFRVIFSVNILFFILGLLTFAPHTHSFVTVYFVVVLLGCFWPYNWACSCMLDNKEGSDLILFTFFCTFTCESSPFINYFGWWVLNWRQFSLVSHCLRTFCLILKENNNFFNYKNLTFWSNGKHLLLTIIIYKVLWIMLDYYQCDVFKINTCFIILILSFIVYVLFYVDLGTTLKKFNCFVV